MQRSAAVLAVAAALLLTFAAPAASFATESTWTDARATFYGRDAWPLHTGSCGFGFICPNRWSGELQQGMDVTAVSDKSDLYGHCGECLEVKCRSAVIPDGTSGTLDRTGLCLNHKSVKVKIVDTCPCVYPNNAASNARWCCGDFPHLDLSQWALEKIADDTSRWGVFGISYRKVDCGLDIGSDAAPAFADAAPDPHANLKPASLNCATQGGSSAGTTAQSSRKAGLTTEASTQTRATSPQRQYWQQWWHTTFKKISADKQKAVYKRIWNRIHKGELSRKGHGV